MLKPLWIGIAVLGAALMAAPAAGYAQAPGADIGKAEYLNRCAVCHGAGGKGDGPLATQLKKTVPDLTMIQKNNAGLFPFDRLYDVIDGRQAVAAHGPRDMPVWGSVYSARAGGLSGGLAAESVTRGQILALIGYLYSLQAK
jgi:mono/diheme cytochrome c family protein